MRHVNKLLLLLLALIVGGCAALPDTDRPASLRPNNVADAGKFGLHVVRSHVLEVVNRPVSLVARSGALLAHTVRDTGRDLAIRLVALPRLQQLPPAPLSHAAGMDLNAWERTLDDIVGDTRRYGKVDLLVDGEEFFSDYVEAVAGAKDSIKLRTYIFDRDDFSLQFADLLKSRSNLVDTLVMFDGIGTILAERTMADSQPDVDSLPLGITTYLLDGSRVEVHNLTNPWFTGDHVKTTIIDHRMAFLGGMNIGREYRYDWHDVMMKVQGQVVADIERDFDLKWAHSNLLGDLRRAAELLKTHSRPAPGEGYPLRVLTTRPLRSDLYRAQVAAIRSAKRRIYIHNAYFAEQSIIYELARARQRGVDVRVILTLGGNHGVMNRSNVITANKLLRCGIRVFAYPGMSHVKAAVYDGWATLGSANFDRLSFRINYEMNLASSATAFTGQVIARLFTPDFAISKEIIEPIPRTWRHGAASLIASFL